MALQGRSQHLDRLGDISLRPGQFEKEPSPQHLRRAVEKVLVQPKGLPHAASKLALQAFAKGSEDSHSLRVEAYAGCCVVLGAYLVGPGLDRLVRRHPSGLARRRFPIAAVGKTVGTPNVDGCLPQVHVGGILGLFGLEQLQQLVLDLAFIALVPKLVELLCPGRRCGNGCTRVNAWLRGDGLLSDRGFQGNATQKKRSESQSAGSFLPEGRAI